MCMSFDGLEPASQRLQKPGFVDAHGGQFSPVNSSWRVILVCAFPTIDNDANAVAKSKPFFILFRFRINFFNLKNKLSENFNKYQVA